MSHIMLHNFRFGPALGLTGEECALLTSVPD
jgi:hypothetical protein